MFNGILGWLILGAFWLAKSKDGQVERMKEATQDRTVVEDGRLSVHVAHKHVKSSARSATTLFQCFGVGWCVLPQSLAAKGSLLLATDAGTAGRATV